MRLGVLDVGSNTVHLLVVDAHVGAAPVPAASHKTDLRLAELLTAAGELSEDGAARLVSVVGQAQRSAKALGVEDLLAFATSAVRDAANSGAVLERVLAETGVELHVLPGDDEAKLTFLAVRRWCGWSAGRLLVLDIGGGSLEVAGGVDEEPDVAISLPLGAGRLTREFLSTDPPKSRELTALRRHVDSQLDSVLPALSAAAQSDLVVATSKTFRQLARVGGAAPSSRGPHVRRTLSRTSLDGVVKKLAGLSSADRARLDGVSVGRAGQLVAGAVVAQHTMAALGVEELVVCPWALREGVILRRLDWLAGG